MSLETSIQELKQSIDKLTAQLSAAPLSVKPEPVVPIEQPIAPTIPTVPVVPVMPALPTFQVPVQQFTPVPFNDKNGLIMYLTDAMGKIAVEKQIKIQEFMNQKGLSDITKMDTQNYQELFDLIEGLKTGA